MAISRGFAFSLIGTGEAERISARLVSAEFFTVFDVKPSLGRAFAPGEDEPGAVPVAVIGADLWQRKFGAAQDVVGKAMTLDEKTYTIIGVLTGGPSYLSYHRRLCADRPVEQSGVKGSQRRPRSPRVWANEAWRHPRAGPSRPEQSDGQSGCDVPGNQQKQRCKSISSQGKNDRGHWTDLVDIAGRGWICAVDRVRKRQQPFARPLNRAYTRVCHSGRPGCGTMAIAPSIIDREHVAGSHRRRARTGLRKLGHKRCARCFADDFATSIRGETGYTCSDFHCGGFSVNRNSGRPRSSTEDYALAFVRHAQGRRPRGERAWSGARRDGRCRDGPRGGPSNRRGIDDSQSQCPLER